METLEAKAPDRNFELDSFLKGKSNSTREHQNMSKSILHL